MVHQVRDLSPEQKAAAELLLGRPLVESESLSVLAFEPANMPEDIRREASMRLQALLDEVGGQLKPMPQDEEEEIFVEAMRSSRPGYRSRR